MKSHEFISEGKDLKSLSRAIAAGDAPAIRNASHTADGYSWGDLRDLGWAEKGYQASGNRAETWWEYSSNAPGPITLVTMGGKNRILQPGDEGDHHEEYYDRED